MGLSQVLETIGLTREISLQLPIGPVTVSKNSSVNPDMLGRSESRLSGGQVRFLLFRHTVVMISG